MADRHVDEVTGVVTTGHEWDGIRELNNPLPRWWLIVFYATIIWSVVYWVFMPAWPGLTGYTKGTRNHSERANVAAERAALEAERAQSLGRLAAVKTVGEVENDPTLFQFTMAAGQSLFGDNCATCHGAGGQGFVGYPNLNDDDWLWDGTFDGIKQTIRHGIRSGDPAARQNVMQAYGRDELLPPQTISDLVEYISSKSGGVADPAAVARAAPVFAQQCASCHGAEGKGDPAQGAPDLTDAIWLYGGDKRSIHETLMNGRAGVMPAWQGRMSESEITSLAVYVHALGGGE
jgi:cytochrome c oxidase cbb3-type subunit 3